jgi:hypothetical protein
MICFCGGCKSCLEEQQAAIGLQGYVTLPGGIDVGSLLHSSEAVETVKGQCSVGAAERSVLMQSAGVIGSFGFVRN